MAFWLNNPSINLSGGSLLGGNLATKGYSPSIPSPKGYQGDPSMKWSKFFAGVGGAMTLGAGIFEAFSVEAQANAQARYYDSAAETAQYNAAQAVAAAQKENDYIAKRSQYEQRQINRELDAMLGAQAAAASAAGVGVDSVTFEHITKDTITTARADEAMLRYNAERQAFENLRSAALAQINADYQAESLRIAGKNARDMGRIGKTAGLIGAAGWAAGSALNLWG